MEKLYCITGVDGTGKSTLIDYFKQNHLDKRKMNFYNLPQYYLGNTALKFANEVELLEEIGKLSDQKKLPVVKASVTFVQYCMFGQMFEEQKNLSEINIIERFPLIDLLVFAKFYLPLLEKNIEFNVKDFIEKNYSGNKLAMLYTIDHDFGLFLIHKKLVEMFKFKRGELISSLLGYLGKFQLNGLIQLSASKDLLNQRLMASQKTKEAHENIEALWMMQNALKSECVEYSKVNSQFKYLEIKVDGLEVKDIYKQVLTNLL